MIAILADGSPRIDTSRMETNSDGGFGGAVRGRGGTTRGQSKMTHVAITTNDAVKSNAPRSLVFNMMPTSK